MRNPSTTRSKGTAGPGDPVGRRGRRSSSSPSLAREGTPSGRLVSTDPRNPAPSTIATRTVMRANRGSDNALELRFRRALADAGIRGYRLHFRTVAGRPDVVFVGLRIAVYVNGCFWHACPMCRLARPKSNSTFWRLKFAANRRRDSRKHALLRSAGWKVVVVWEHDLVTTARSAVSALRAALRESL